MKSAAETAPRTTGSTDESQAAETEQTKPVRWLFAPLRVLWRLFKPVSVEKQNLLQRRWLDLPDSLRTPNQVIGKHWVHCGYTLGPAFCSFGCSHCYLPRGANRLPMVTLGSMKAQIDAQRRLMGPGGNLQITGGDVVEAYWREGRKEELIEVVRYAVENDLVPMLMTHGQVLLDHPDYLERLVLEGGLRKISVHIDITMAGRPGFPLRTLARESDLNALRSRFVQLVLETRRKTGKRLVAAQTVTVTHANIDSIGDIIGWLISSTDRLDVCRTLSFQTEANVGRTRYSSEPVNPATVWQRLGQATGKALDREHLLFGHPDCSSTATLLVAPSRQQVVNLSSASPEGRLFWQELMAAFGGIDAKTVRPVSSAMQKVGAILRRPKVALRLLGLFCQMLRARELTIGFVGSALCGNVRGFNLVMHNFMSEDEMAEPRSARALERLKACAFRGAILRDGEWQAVSMCEMNAKLRPEIYRHTRADQDTAPISLKFPRAD